MALLASTSVVGVQGLKSELIQRSTFWSSSSERSRLSLPMSVEPSMKKGRKAGKQIIITGAIQVDPPASMADEPESPGKVVPAKTPSSTNKGWTDDMDLPDIRIVSQLRELATIASDRSEMHHVLSVQRDNWNILFHNTITMASVSAAMAAALNGVEHASGLSVVASGMGLGVAALMALINFFQPSQLAEEQRTAARFFKRLTTDIESTLEVDPRLRQQASRYLEQKLGTLHALDSAFPMPLTPVVLEKFPKVICASILSDPPAPMTSEFPTTSSRSANGWTPAIENDLRRTSRILHEKDIPTYIEMATEVNHLNKVLAIVSTVLATSGALCNVVDAIPAMHTSVLGAAFTVGAYFVHSLSHAAQLGAAYETYRNCSGYYADLERSIETVLRIPVEQREYGVTFLERIALQLGRSPTDSPVVPLDQEKAGTLF